jgi:hypothetical protein
MEISASPRHQHFQHHDLNHHHIHFEHRHHNSTNIMSKNIPEHTTGRGMCEAAGEKRVAGEVWWRLEARYLLRQ